MATNSGRSTAAGANGLQPDVERLHAYLMESLGHANADADRQESYWEIGTTDFEDFLDEVVADVSTYWAPDGGTAQDGSTTTAASRGSDSPSAGK